MEIIIFTLIMGFLLALFVLIPRLFKSDQSKSVQSNNIGKIYDVTSYVEEHPGGDAILAHAGDDSTDGFYGPQHATRVFDMIEDFYVGDLQK